MPQNTLHNRSSRRRDVVGLIAFLALCFLVSVIGGLVTATSVGGWYLTLEKPSFNPPGWVFGPVWTLLYAMMAVAAWRVWRVAQGRTRTRALSVFGLQLGLNLLWSVLFFGFQQVGIALVDICLLFGAIAVNAVLFWRIERMSGWLFLPYLLWVAFAALLNLSIWLLN